MMFEKWKVWKADSLTHTIHVCHDYLQVSLWVKKPTQKTAVFFKSGFVMFCSCFVWSGSPQKPNVAPKEAAVLSLFEVWIFLLYDLVSGCMFAENFFEKTYRKKG